MTDPDHRFPAAGLVRTTRRRADLSQRQLANKSGVAPSTISRIESGGLRPSLDVLVRLLGVAGIELVAVDSERRQVLPMLALDDTRDGAERLYPSHLDTVLDPGSANGGP